jgi:drug/metabolite transporter (DMT)-like permease
MMRLAWAPGSPATVSCHNQRLHLDHAGIPAVFYAIPNRHVAGRAASRREIADSGAMTDAAMPPVQPQVARREERIGLLLVFLSALVWSFGGAIARFLETPDSWTVVFWRSLWAAVFLIGFMMLRDGVRGTLKLFRDMGLPGVAVAACFAIASTSFIVAIAHTTVANVVLMQAGVPLIAALLAFLLFRERVAPATWAAIAAVICGVAIMVSESFDGSVSPIGDGLAVLIAFAFSIATVITRRYSHVRMTPATCLGTIFAASFAATQAGGFAVSGYDMTWLFAFGALNLGLGLACFATGARLIPAAFTALLGTFETLLSPVWVWLFHGEIPSTRTLLGGAVIFTALLVHIALEFQRMSRPQRAGVTGLPSPN